MIRACLLALLLSPAAAAVAKADVVIFAASSLKTALDEVLVGMDARVSYGGSGALARQIMQGAPADVFVSANPVWMDAVADKVAVADRVDLLSNAIVVVSRDQDMLQAEGHVAMGLLNSVPVGIYGKAYLQAAGLWVSVAPRVVETDSARAALALAARGEVAYAVVYATDAAAAPSLKVVASLPPRDDLPILYPMAVLSDQPGARDVFDHLQTAGARAVFARHGFLVP